MPRKKQKLVVVLVDYENVVLRAKKEGFSVSFSRLRELVRSFGQVCEAVVFIPPHVATDAETVTILCDAGFEVVACPLEKKDKDAVDAYLKAHARRKALWSQATTFIIVSEDADLSRDPDLTSIVQDVGKTVEFLRPTEHRQAIEGMDIATEIKPTEFQQECEQAIDDLLAEQEPTDTQARETYRFMADVIKNAYDAGESAELGFRQLTDRVWAQLVDDWHRIFNDSHVRTALSALIGKGLIEPIQARHIRYYKFNHDHPSVALIRYAPSSAD